MQSKWAFLNVLSKLFVQYPFTLTCKEFFEPFGLLHFWRYLRYFLILCFFSTLLLLISVWSSFLIFFSNYGWAVIEACGWVELNSPRLKSKVSLGDTCDVSRKKSMSKESGPYISSESFWSKKKMSGPWERDILFVWEACCEFFICYMINKYLKF